jgi:sn-glycerol 3-phosphate transport system ATP-binding protein
MLFQNPALYPHLTVAQNVEFPLKVRGNPSQDTAQRVGPIVERLGLDTLLHRLPETLSGGERQRVALARAWVLEPKILLLDEPFTALDAPLRQELRRHLKTLQFKSPVAVIHVTHDQAEALATGDKVAVMRSGTFEQIEDPQSLYERPSSTFVAQFIGSPGMNLIEGTLSSNHKATEFLPAATATPLDVAVPQSLAGRQSRSLFLGVRAESLRLSEGPSSSGNFIIERAECRGPNWLIFGLWSGVPVQVFHPGPKPAPGNRHRLDCPEDTLHWFDRDSGLRID